MHDVPFSVAVRFPGLHEAQEQQEARNVLADPVLSASLRVTERNWSEGLWSVRTAEAPEHGPGNQVTGLTAGGLTEERLRNILTRVTPWFDEVGCSLGLRVPAAHIDDDVGRTLSSAGFAVAEVEAWMAAPLASLAIAPVSIEIRVADDEASLDAFVEAFCLGWRVDSAQGRAIARAALARQPAPSWWRRYVATIDGKTAGEAVLAWFDDVAYLAEAATVPAFRRRGVQRALIARRLADAKDLGCQQVFSAVQYGDPSWANMRGQGLREANVTVAFRRAPSQD